MTISYTKPERALAAHFNLTGALDEQIEQTGHNSDLYTVEGEPGEYLVLTDSEADDMADQQLESYIDECVLTEIPAAYQSYFNREVWKRDALISDGRGHFISGYDGEEHEVQIDGEWFYIYRVN